MIPTLVDILIRIEPELENSDLSMSHFDKYGMPMFGGCEFCRAQIAAYNSCVGKNGYLIGKCCASETNTLNIEEAVKLYTNK